MFQDDDSNAMEMVDMTGRSMSNSMFGIPKRRVSIKERRNHSIRMNSLKASLDHSRLSRTSSVASIEGRSPRVRELVANRLK